MKYREIQAAHEESVLDSFIKFQGRNGIDLEVLDRPDPPDAIVNLNSEPCWIEITDAFQSEDWAISVTSYPAEDRPHRPYQRRLIYEPDRSACSKVLEVILKKYGKATMIQLLYKHGQGILLVGAYTPLTSLDEIIELAGDEILAEIAEHERVFRSIYLYRNSSTGHEFAQLL